MGAYCEVFMPIKPGASLPQDVTIRLAYEFSRHLSKPLANDSESDLAQFLNRTVAAAFARGVEWNAKSKRFVYRYAKELAIEASRFADAENAAEIAGRHVRMAAESVLAQGRNVEKRILRRSA